MNATDAAVIATDLEGRVVFWNSVAEQIYGWKWEDAIGRIITELVVPSTAQPRAETILKKLRQSESWSGEFPVRRRDGSQFVAEVTDHPMHDAKGNLVGIIGVSRPRSEA
jgi:PAS domain S-box-containing protein